MLLHPLRDSSDFRRSRRRWLARAGALASSTALPAWLPGAWAQTLSPLNALPRVGLIIGNTNYTEAPLRNSVNDAKAIGAELQKHGFRVNVQLNAARAQMVDAIQTFTGDLAKSKGVGLFYYAGHGAQLAWRNYLIPIDAAIAKLEDLRDKAVELNSLLQGLVAASNPMNMIILDACRDNPFGNKVLTEQKGLSQFDAPPGSLLAYATAPGNTAADGEGENGLYTENLLRELTVPETKLEDVFKRVRLAVRNRSEGRQIPWESTSLEQDFYFQPPKQIRKLSPEEQERQFEEELAIWEKIKSAKETAPLEDYLRRFPSGKFSEVAQFRLERVLAQREKPLQIAAVRQEELARAEAEVRKQQELSKAEADRKHQEQLARAEAELKKQQELAKAETAAKFTSNAIGIASIAPNPFSKGTAVADANYKVGDSYTHGVTDLFTKIEKRLTRTITEITDSEVIYDNGNIKDLLGNTLRSPTGRRSTGYQLWGVSYAVGKRWTSRSKDIYPKGNSAQTELEVRVVARENITVPAGTFDAFVLEVNGWAIGSGINTQIQQKFWIAPDQVRQQIVEESQYRWGGKLQVWERWELVAYREA